MSFMSLFVSFFPEPVFAEIPFLIFAPKVLTPPSTRRFLMCFLDLGICFFEAFFQLI